MREARFQSTRARNIVLLLRYTRTRMRIRTDLGSPFIAFDQHDSSFSLQRLIIIFADRKVIRGDL